MKISVVLPIYNEEENLFKMHEELTATLSRLPHDYEIVAVDDASSDRSPEILEQLSKKDPKFRAVLFRANRGQSAAFDAGFRESTGDVVVTMDADLQNDPADIPKMLTLIESGYDFVAGWRKNRKDGFILRTFPSKIANWIIRKVTKTKLHDLGCSLKMYKRAIVDELFLYGEMHRFIGVLVETIGARVAEIEAHHRPRYAGVSKYNLSRTLKVLFDLLTVWFFRNYHTKPNYVFGGMAAFLTFVSMALCGWVLYDKFILDVYVHRNPLFTIAVFSGMLAVQFLVLGLLAEMMVRTYFESQNKRPYSIKKRFN